MRRRVAIEQHVLEPAAIARRNYGLWCYIETRIEIKKWHLSSPVCRLSNLLKAEFNILAVALSVWISSISTLPGQVRALLNADRAGSRFSGRGIKCQRSVALMLDSTVS